MNINGLDLKCFNANILFTEEQLRVTISTEVVKFVKSNQNSLKQYNWTFMKTHSIWTTETQVCSWLIWISDHSH